MCQKHAKATNASRKSHSLVRFMEDGGIIGPYFFKDAANRNVTVNGERYPEMTSNFFLPKMQELDLHDMWFQQDGATCHTTRVNMTLLQETFPYLKRINACNTSCGGHLNDVVFHT